MNATKPAPPTQCDLILAELRRCEGQWVSMIILHQVSGSMAVHSRIAELRGHGHTIEQHSKRVGRIQHSSYRLIPGETQPLML